MNGRVLLLCLPLLASCGPDAIVYGRGDSEIVFGIGIATTPDGKTVTSAGWDILSLGGKGSSLTILADRDRECILEDLSTRLGQPRVDRGTATFRGGKLSADGLAIQANQVDEPHVDGPGWATGDVLTFQSTGFAAPDIGPTRIAAASAELALKTPALDGTSPLTVARDADFEVTWDPGVSPPPERVVVVLDTDGQQEIRCFFDRAAGSGKVPHDLFAKLPPMAKGTLDVKTQRQAAGLAGGDAWTVYVVTTVQHREQSFVLDH